MENEKILETEKVNFNDEFTKVLLESPIIALAQKLMEETKDKNKKLTKEILCILEEELEKDYIDLLDIFTILSNCIIAVAKLMTDNDENFNSELTIARNMVSENIMQALGFNSNDSILNKNSIVEFKGTYDEENFSLRRMSMISGVILEYFLWNKSMSNALKESGIEED